MDRDLPRSELVKTLEARTEQLHRYETRLRDVVQAYKGVIKEKEALEATVKVLSSSTKQSSREGSGETSQSEHLSHPLGGNQSETETDGSSDDSNSLREKVSTLSASISTLSEEKSRLEAGYVAEKKKLRQDNEDLSQRLNELKQNAATKEQDKKEEIQTLKNKVRSQQHEREKEQTDHAVMLRELQKLLATERATTERLENQLDDERERLRSRDNQPDVSEQYQKRIRDLSTELQGVRNRMKAAEVKSDEPSPLLLELQREMAEMKAQYRIQVVQEQRRANEAEEKLQEAAKQGEERVSGLEDKLSELSEVVGNYERLRYQDQQAIQRLKERVTQLDLENSALVQAVHQPEKEFDSTNEDNLDAQTLANKIVRLKALLKLANDRSEKPVNLEEVLGSGSTGCRSCEQFREEMTTVREEFERYKLRAQSVLKNKARDPGATKMEDTLRSDVSQLKDKVKTLRLQCDDAELKQKIKEEELTKTMMSLQQRHRVDLDQKLGEHKQELGVLEQQLKKQRDRTIALLSEKDHEIEQLRGASTSRHATKYPSPHYMTTEDSFSQQTSLTRSKSEEDEAVFQLIQQRQGLLQGDTNLLHHIQEQARRDVEISSLRKIKRQLENALRELQQSSSMKEEKYQDEIEQLRENIRKNERYKSREGANLEYLKNVTYRFLTSSNLQAKQQMFNAISTILQFSPKEKTKVEYFMKSWWGT